MIPRISYRVFKVFHRNFIVFKKNWISNITFNFIEPLLYLWALGYGLGVFVEKIDGMPYLNWLAPGLTASSAMWASSFECTYDSYMRMSYQRIYHAIIATPVNLEEVILGEMIFGTFKSLLYGSVFMVVLFFLGLVSSPWALLVPLVLVLAGLAISEMAISWTGIVPNIDSFNFFFTLVITPMFLISGVFFPVNDLSIYIKAIAWLTPLYHSVEIIRALVLDMVKPQLFYHVLWLLSFIILFYKIPIMLMHRRLIDK
ncbi:MAG: ABC transporter permease [Clostridiales bacterium]|nr:ABC transporter permease [Clostridiales bacterium]MCF8021425.1 ABC transporter permease [Clostridiales bacterium]